jgi:hypothetical protein
VSGADAAAEGARGLTKSTHVMVVEDSLLAEEVCWSAGGHWYNTLAHIHNVGITAAAASGMPSSSGVISACFGTEDMFWMPSISRMQCFGLAMMAV